jgi:DNA-binding MarR family transcriptional regulator
MSTEIRSTRKRNLTVAEYRKLSELRFQIRRFLRFSEDAARGKGLEPQQHQTLLAIKGAPAGDAPTIAFLANRMQLAHHTMVELVDRVVDKGLAQRKPSTTDRRSTLVQLTPEGTKVLGDLSVLTYEQIQTKFVELLEALQCVVEDRPQPANDNGHGKTAKARKP